jgi:hypothetical protein
VRHDQHGAFGRIRCTQSCKQISSPVSEIENPGFDPWRSAQSVFEVARNGDFVTGRILCIDRDDSFEVGSRIPLGSRPIETGWRRRGDLEGIRAPNLWLKQ